ncbi:WD40-repeat-containing domain protein [Trichoderma sp. SZMC 28011]
MSNDETISSLSQQYSDEFPQDREQGYPEAAQILTKLQEKSESMLGRRAQEIVSIEDCAATAAQTVIQGSGLRAFIDPLLEPLCFGLVDTLPQGVETYKVAYSHDGKYIATGDDRGNAYVFDAARRRILFQKGVEVKALIPSPVCFTPDGQSFIFASGGLVQVCDITTKTVRHSLDHKSGVSALDVSNDCRLLASGDFCGTVHIWNLEQGVKIKEFIVGDGYIYDVKISSDSCFAAAVCDDGHAYTWNLKTGDCDAKLHHGKRVRSVALSSDGKFLVTGGDSDFKVWDRDTGVCSSYSEATGSALTALSMTPDDRWIVTASNRGSIRFWDRTTGKSHCIVDAHKQTIYAMAFKPRGGYFATVSGDKTVRIWSYGLRR